MSKPMTNQASEDELTYGVDRGIPGGDSTALSIKKGSTLYAFVGDEAVAIIDVIRTEKLKLLAEVREQVIGKDCSDEVSGGSCFDCEMDSGYYANAHNTLKDEQRTALTKLEAEL